MKILVVDDYATMRRIVRNLLTQIGFSDIEEAGDGVTALAKLRESKFGLVISDWNMEPMTGLQLLKEIRADNKLNATPFIMVTAESKTENVVAAKEAGVNNYIVKPFNANRLKQKDHVGHRALKADGIKAVDKMAPLTEDEFEHIEDTVARTAKGRAFLRRYAQRVQGGVADDVRIMLDQMRALLNQNSQVSGSSSHIEVLRRELLEMAGSIEKARREVARSSHPMPGTTGSCRPPVNSTPSSHPPSGRRSTS